MDDSKVCENKHPNLPALLFIENNKKVTYAYLCWEDDITADVWLFNSYNTPNEPEWVDKSKIPFLNSNEFCYEKQLKPKDIEEFIFQWEGNDYQELVVKLLLNNKLFAILKNGSKPGWSVNTKKNGPLSRRICEYKESTTS